MEATKAGERVLSAEEVERVRMMLTIVGDRERRELEAKYPELKQQPLSRDASNKEEGDDDDDSPPRLIVPVGKDLLEATLGDNPFMLDFGIRSCAFSYSHFVGMRRIKAFSEPDASARSYIASTSAKIRGNAVAIKDKLEENWPKLQASLAAAIGESLTATWQWVKEHKPTGLPIPGAPKPEGGAAEKGEGEGEGNAGKENGVTGGAEGEGREAAAEGKVGKAESGDAAREGAEARSTEGAEEVTIVTDEGEGETKAEEVKQGEGASEDSRVEERKEEVLDERERARRAKEEERQVKEEAQRKEEEARRELEALVARMEKWEILFRNPSLASAPAQSLQFACNAAGGCKGGFIERRRGEVWLCLESCPRNAATHENVLCFPGPYQVPHPQPCAPPPTIPPPPTMPSIPFLPPRPAVPPRLQRSLALVHQKLATWQQVVVSPAVLLDASLAVIVANGGTVPENKGYQPSFPLEAQKSDRGAGKGDESAGKEGQEGEGQGSAIRWGSAVIRGHYLPKRIGESLLLSPQNFMAVSEALRYAWSNGGPYHVAVSPDPRNPSPLCLPLLPPYLMPNPTPFLPSPPFFPACQLAVTLPARLRTSPWRLLYSTARDGISMATLFRKIKGKGACLLVVRDSNKYVFGCFTNEEWRPMDRYYGNGECFVFQVQPECVAYRWARTNSYFMLSSNAMLAVGGGILLLDVAFSVLIRCTIFHASHLLKLLIHGVAMSPFPMSPFPMSPFPMSPFPMSPFPMSPFPMSPFPMSPFPMSPFPMAPLSPCSLFASPCCLTSSEEFEVAQVEVWGFK
ncbi:unnamed protein product [Closterium sp. Naga37s-1]|nr:unnamed protein product [Closterium sp. Naga37s-1]